METRKIKTPGGVDSGKMNPLPAGRILEGRYKIERKLGSGGVGFVYKALHLRLNRSVAVKVLQPQYTASPKLKARFEREAQALATMTHPNIVTISDYGVTDKMPFLVMELLQGEPLSERLKKGSIDPRSALEIARQILQALAFAHEHGWVHRDLKPGNVFLQELAGGSIHIKILDFGLAKLVATDGRAKGPQLTLTGMVFGTPAYMAPEQAVGGETDARTDLYSTGVVLYEMLAGRRLFLGEADQLMRQHLQTPPPLLHEACPTRRATPELEAFLRKTLEKERGERYQSAKEMIEAMDRLPDTACLEGDAATACVEDGEESRSSVSFDHIDRPSEALTVEATPTPRPHPSYEPPAEPRRPPTLFIVVGAAVIVAIIALVVVLAVAFSGESEGNEQQGGAQPIASDGGQPSAVPSEAGPERHIDASQAGTTEPSPPPPPPPPPVEPTNSSGLWATDDMAPMLVSAHHMLESGSELPQGLYNRLRNYAITHRDDPRPFILLGWHNVRRGHLTDAISNYQRAYDADAQSRNDPRMRHDLMELVESNSVGYRASRAVISIYGREAIGDVDRALAQDDLDEGARRRLERLRDALRTGR